MRLGVSPAAASTPRVFSLRGVRLYFPKLEPWVAQSVCFPAVPPGSSMRKCGVAGSASCCTACPVCSTIRHLSGSGRVATHPLHPGCWCSPLLLVWMNVSSLSHWLSDSRAVRFSVSSGCFLILNCCPSFGCARRCSVSTYASILARSPYSHFLKFCFLFAVLVGCFLLPYSPNCLIQLHLLYC